MKFGRLNLIFFLLVMALVGGLVLWHFFGPRARLEVGRYLFPVEAAEVVEVAWEVTPGVEPAERVRLVREGEFWRLAEPTPGLLCDAAAVARLLDAALALRVSADVGPVAQSAFQVERSLTLKTPDATYSCGFGSHSPMALSQTLAAVGEDLAVVEVAEVNRLPETAAELRSRALVPVEANRVLSLDWRAPGRPFTRAQRLENGHWNVTRPFPFEPKPDAVAHALAVLTNPQVVEAYIQPEERAVAEVASALSSETNLSRYGLDEERALRLSVRASGLRNPLAIRFGKADPAREGYVFALLDGHQAVVSVPQALPALFGSSGPFSTDFRNLPVMGDAPAVGVCALRGVGSEAPAIVVRQSGRWQLTCPLNLPADAAAVQACVGALTALSGDLVGIEPPEADVPLCEVTLAAEGAKPEEGCQLQLFGNPQDETLGAFRKDQGRYYRVKREALPELLFMAAPDHALVDRTVLSVPAAGIRRVARLARNGDQVSVRRLEGTVWEVESPKGLYLDEAVLDAWLTAFADLKAVRVLRNAPTTFGELQIYGLESPYLRVTLDLDGAGESLRRVLCIGTPNAETGTAPALIQGRPVLYELSREMVELFAQPLVRESGTPE